MNILDFNIILSENFLCNSILWRREAFILIPSEWEAN